MIVRCDTPENAVRLSTFIRNNEETILQKWEDFAQSIRSAPSAMDKAALRDHARSMLDAIVEDIDTPATGRRQTGKFRRLSPRGREETAAQAHGSDRMEWEFEIGDMVSEFRALRASVIRLWSDSSSGTNPEEMVRFNEAIDRALADSVDGYARENEQQHRLLNAMLANSSDHSFIFDRNGNFLYVNRTMANVYGVHPSEMIGKPIEDFDPSLAAEVHRQVRHVIDAGKECRGEVTIRSASGNEHVIEYLFAPIMDSDGNIEAVAGNSRDITDRKAWERTLWKHANHDHLTGIPNRRLFIDRLGQAIKRVRRSRGLLALLYIDLDRFKDANDYLGHDGGDALLKEAAKRIASCIRETDTVARLGGDEFTVILMDVGDRNHVEGVSRAILTRLARPFSIDNETVRISGSIGIALYPDHGNGVDDLMSYADQAMYTAKSGGGDQFHCHSREDGQREVAGRAAPDRRRMH